MRLDVFLGEIERFAKQLLACTIVPMNASAASLPHATTPLRPEGMREWYRLGWSLPWLVLTICLAATYVLWHNEQQNAIKDLQIDFDFRVREVEARLIQRMTAYEQVLRGARSLFVSSRNVTTGEFSAYVESLHLEDHYPGAHGIGFSLIVPEAQQKQRVADISKQGFVMGEFGANSPARNAVSYFVPFPGDKPATFGYHVYDDPVHRAAMDMARDTGDAVNSAKLSLAPETGEQEPMSEGFLMYLPVYRNGATHRTLAERRANIVGWVYAPFHMMDLMAGLIGDLATEVDIEVHDGADISDASMMYDPDVSGVGGNPHAKFKSASRIEIAHRDWTVVLRSLYGFEMRADTGKPAIVAFAGVGVSMLLALLTWLLVRGRVVAVQAHEKIHRELLERKRAEEGLRLASTVVKSVEEAVMVTDTDNKIIAVNPAFTAITGYKPEEVTGRNPRMLSSGKHTQEFFKDLWGTLLSTDSWHGEIFDRRKNGEIYVKWLSIRAVRDERGKLSNYVAVFSDITERKATEERMQHLAHYDVLTDLPNRVLFSDRLQQALVQAKRDNIHLALMFLDLDKFKPINDEFGHAVGDVLLKEVAQRLQRCVRGSDTVSRVGGDEFIVLLPAIDAQQDAMQVAEKMRLSLSQPFDLVGQRIFISVSIGVAVYPEHGSDEISLTKSADTAMYCAKDSLRGNVQLYRADMAAKKSSLSELPA